MTATHRQEEIKAMTRERVTLFLATSEREAPPLAVLFLLFARTGIRIGEGLALQWDDSWASRANPSRTPGRRGFLGSRTPYDLAFIQRAFKRVVKAARLPLHFTPHCLRHTYASLMLQAGESPIYVRRQLGHASIKLTVDTYSNWLRWVTRPPSAGSTTSTPVAKR